MECWHFEPCTQHFSSQNPPERLHLAALEDNISLLRELLQTGSNKDQISAFGTPLHVAVFANQLDAVKVLVNAGADIEIIHPDHGVTQGDPFENALRMAVRLGRREIFRFLWDVGARHNNGRTKDGPLLGPHFQRSLLELAAMEDHPELVADLLDFSDEWTRTEKDSALGHASMLWSPVSIEGLFNNTRFDDQVLSRSLEMCNFWGSPKSWNGGRYRRNWTRKDSLKQARCVELLLNAHSGSPLNYAKHLCIAALRPWCIETLKLLLRRGVDPNARLEPSQLTALHRAVAIPNGRAWPAEQNSEAVSTLLQSGADPDLSDDKGKTALHRAVVRGGDLGTIRRLLEAGANIGARDKEGTTPMIEVAYSGYYGSFERKKLQTGLCGFQIINNAFDGATRWKCGEVLGRDAHEGGVIYGPAYRVAPSSLHPSNSNNSRPHPSLKFDAQDHRKAKLATRGVHAVSPESYRCIGNVAIGPRTPGQPAISAISGDEH
ncbi:ankyrin [Polyplosphaeria fusca]|uniref:Ankyrin n=1 Tax=Polyplosphaeria fusca TaxID=682080 RepID=A0A9P4QTA9_9PLEO|nr:ankyrin [Polyplosphaeria fusca]